MATGGSETHTNAGVREVCPPDLPPDPWYRRYEGFILAVFALLAVVLGVIGFEQQGREVGSDRTLIGSLYASIQLFALEYSGEGPVGWPLEVARFAAPMIAAFAAVMALMLLLGERVQLLRLRFGKSHAVVVGLGEMGIALTRSLRRRGVPVVAIERNPGSPMVDPARELGAIVIQGDARDPEMLRKARIQHARHLVSVCSDGVNADVAIRAAALVAERDGRVLECRVHIVDPTLCRMLMTHEMAKSTSGRCRLEYFNIYESGARSLLAEYPPFDPQAKSPPNRLVIVGLGALGRVVALQATQAWRTIVAGDPIPLRIAIVDPDAVQKTQDLVNQYPQLEKTCDLDPIEAEIVPPAWKSGGFPAGTWEPAGLGAVYVCMDVESDAIAAGLWIGPELRGLGIPVVVCLGHRSGLGSFLNTGGNGQFRNLHAFGLLDQTCDYDLLFAGAYESIARAQHAEYVSAERKKGTDPALNPSMVPWHQLPEVLKESNRDQAASIGMKLAAVDCDIEPLADWGSGLFEFSAGEIESLARLEHERWVNERRRMGWKPGKRKDVKKRLTPYLVSWEELPKDIREHDRIVVRGLPGFLARVGFQVVRGQGTRVVRA